MFAGLGKVSLHNYIPTKLIHTYDVSYVKTLLLRKYYEATLSQRKSFT